MDQSRLFSSILKRKWGGEEFHLRISALYEYVHPAELHFEFLYSFFFFIILFPFSNSMKIHNLFLFLMNVEQGSTGHVSVPVLSPPIS